MTAPVVVVAQPVERALVSDGAQVAGVPVGSAAEWTAAPAGGATRLLVAVGDGELPLTGAREGRAAEEAELPEPAPAPVTVRWLAGVNRPGTLHDELVIAQGGEGLWRRAPWPVGDDLYAIAPAPSTSHVLVLGEAAGRRAAVADALNGRGVSARAIERLDRQALATAAALVWLGSPQQSLPAWLMAPLAAGRVLIVAGRSADFGLQPGVDHLSAFDDDEAVALAAAVAARPDTLAALRFFGRRAAEHHRASRVFARLLGDVDRERPRARVAD